MHVMLARLHGARRVIVSDLLAGRLPLAVWAGADRTVHPPEEDLAAVVAGESGGQGADAIVVAAPSHQAQEEALRLAAIGGRINFFGGLPRDRPAIQFDSNAVHYRELVVTGTTACSTGDCWRAAALVNAGRVDLRPLVSARFPLREALAAFATAEERTSLKVVIEPASVR
jgi:L-iditol 2-dehydrogenase